MSNEQNKECNTLKKIPNLTKKLDEFSIHSATFVGAALQGYRRICLFMIQKNEAKYISKENKLWRCLHSGRPPLHKAPSSKSNMQ